MKDKEEKPKEETKKNNSSELGSLISDDGLHKLIFDKEKDNKIKGAKTGGAALLEWKDKNDNSKKEEPLVLKGSVIHNEYKINPKEQTGYACSENKDYKPQHDTYKELAIDSYSNAGSNIKEYKPLLESENKNTGFFSRAYLDNKNKTIVISYKGTDPGSIKDWFQNNIPMKKRKVIPKQFYDAENFYHDIKDKLGKNAKNYKFVFTGHSLGGTLAELMGAKYGNETVTFNAYGADNLKDTTKIYQDNITNYGHIKDKIFNMKSGEHIGKSVYVTDDGSSKGSLDYHKAENLDNLKRSVKTKK